MSETAMPSENDSSDDRQWQPADADAVVAQVAHEIVRALLTAKGDVTTRADLERIVPRRTSLTTKAVSLLLRDGRITGGRGQAYRVVSPGAET
jgi:hypothetical protein